MIAGAMDNMKCSQCRDGITDDKHKMCETCRERARRDYYTNRNKILARQQNNPESHRKANRKYLEKNKEMLNEKSRIYRLENAEQRKETQRKYRERNKEKIRNHNLEYRAANPEKLKKYYADNIEKIRMNAKNQKYKRRQAEGKITLEEWESVLRKYNYTCLGCGRTDVKLTIDHVIPLSREGKNSLDNVQPLCFSCNSKKHTKILDFRPFGRAILDWT